ncbi:hypothetical protein PCL_05547 [Purpureocillium lilacinum]|uniref:Uncharacterized protein n=1 Tax=Purpureocillium lilacinum TaxID=33203 RepID=A0A2U3DUY9_PURLI|nr:hypothetical protein PCL_05547 [Purpureocillium lilacinum]
MGNDDTLMEGEGQHARPPARPPARLTMPCCLALPCQLALRLAGGARGGGGGIDGGAAAPCLGETLKAILNGCPPAPMPPFVRSMEGPAGWAGGREKQDNLATVDACGACPPALPREGGRRRRVPGPRSSPNCPPPIHFFLNIPQPKGTAAASTTLLPLPPPHPPPKSNSSSRLLAPRVFRPLCHLSVLPPRFLIFIFLLSSFSSF